MRTLLLLTVLAISAGALLSMLYGMWRHQEGAVEYVWSLIPWVIVVLCGSPAVHRILSWPG